MGGCGRDKRVVERRGKTTRKAGCAAVLIFFFLQWEPQAIDSHDRITLSRSHPLLDTRTKGTNKQSRGERKKGSAGSLKDR